MRNNIVLLTYPGHFLLSKLAIESIKKISPQSNITVIADNISNLTWNGYIDDCKVFYGVEVIPTNQTLNLLTMFKGDGWLRQQMVKLNLDRFLPGDLWYVTDGDIICERLIGANEIPYNYQTTHNPLINAQQHMYIKHMLGINQKLQLNGEDIYTHHIPVRWVTRDDLHSLYRHVSDVNQNDANIAHFNLMRKERIIGYGPTPEHLSMTEWDLLETWRILIDEQQPKYRYWILDDGAAPRKNVPVSRLKTFFGTDRDFSQEYFENQGLQVPADAWKKVLEISRT